MFTFNIKSASFWSSVGGAAATILGALGEAHLGAAVNQALIYVGGVLIAIPSHHVIKAQVARKSSGNA